MALIQWRGFQNTRQTRGGRIASSVYPRNLLFITEHLNDGRKILGDTTKGRLDLAKRRDCHHVDRLAGSQEVPLMPKQLDSAVPADFGAVLAAMSCHEAALRIEEAIPTTSHPLVHEAMIWTQQLYDIEDRAQGMSADDRRTLRQAEALPILARMKARFEEVRPTLRPTSKLAEAIDYVLNRWDAFLRYTSDGRIPIDNNVMERLLRPVAIGRKNYLFFGSEKGGQTAATLYTLVQSAHRNCVDVWPYLTDVLRRIAAIAPGETTALEALLPDRWVAAHPEHRLEQREEESREAQARRRRRRAARRAAAAR